MGGHREDRLHILVVRTDRIGETLLTTPLISALRKKYPQACISVLANPVSCTALERNPDIHEIIPYPETHGMPWWLETGRFLSVLRSRSFDMVFVANSKKAFHLGSALKRIPVRAGFNRKWPFFLSHAVVDERRSGQRHEVEYNLDLIAPFAGRVEPERPSLAADPDAERWADRWFKERGWGRESKQVAISPFSTHVKKEWHPESFLELIRLLLSEENCRVILLGASNDRARSETYFSGLGHRYANLCGRTTLGQAAALFVRSHLLVSNDSGLVHVAASIGLPTVVLFRHATDEDSPRRWGPFGEGHTVLCASPGAQHRREPQPKEVFQACLKKIR